MRALPLLLLTATLSLRAAGDANAILQRLIEAGKQNDQLARQYTYHEEAAWSSYNQQGQLHQNRSETHEVIFVEGLKYRKLTARNGKPLSAKEAAQVEKEMRETAEERRKHPQPAAGGLISFGHFQTDLGSLPELLTFFDNRLAGEEEVGGRKARVIECVPQAGHTPVNQHEKDILSFHKKLWVDESDNLLRMTVTVGEDGLHSRDGKTLAAPGSFLTLEFSKINDQVWEPVSVVLEVYRLSGKTVKPWTRTEYRQSRFQKFAVESTITLETPK